MITLDLLPIKEKKLLNTRKSYAISKKIAYVSLIIVSSMAIIVIVSKYIIQSDLNHITEQKNTIITNNKGLNIEIQDYNNKLKKLSEIQKENKNLSEIIIMVSEFIPNGITLNYLGLDQSEENTFNLKIKGFSDSRDTLITFKDSLNSKDFFKKIDIPLSSLLKQTDIEFEIATNLYLDKLK